MTSSKENNMQLFIDKEALASLAMMQEGLLSPVHALMNEKTSLEVDTTGVFEGKTFPFSFVLAPSGKRNHEVLKNAKKGDRLTLVEGGNVCGHIIVDEVFPIDREKRVAKIFGTTDASHIGAYNTFKRLGSLAICGELSVVFPEVKEALTTIGEAKAAVHANHVTGLVMSAKPLNRAHERLMRLLLERTDLIVIFLTRSYTHEEICFDFRYKTLLHMIDNYFPKNRVVVVPLEKTYIFGGINEVILDSIVLQNSGCNRFVIGREHTGLGAYYEKDTMKSIVDTLKGITIKIEISSNFVYCDKCKTLVSATTCPHGQHHHISYHSHSIMELMRAGLMPPNILVRKEISAMYLQHLHPNRFSNLQTIYADLIPSYGLIENHSEYDFYIELAKLYQTTSLS